MMQDRRRMAGGWLVAGIMAAGALAPQPAGADAHKAKAMKSPVVSRVVYQGAKHLYEKELSALTGVREGRPLDPALNRRACRKIVGRLHEDGRPFATCQLLKGGSAGDTEVVFQITEGPRARVGEIRFEGNTFVTAARLRTQIHGSTGLYRPCIIDDDVVTLMKYYRGFGFRDVAVSRELQYAPDGHDLILTFHIKEGPRSKVASVAEVIGVTSVPHEQLEAVSKVKAASVDDRRIIDDTKAITDVISYHTHQARVEAVPVWSKDVPGGVDVQYQVQEQPPARVGQIFIIGNEKTRQDVVISRGSLPGPVTCPSDLRTAEKGLIRLGIFNDEKLMVTCPATNVAESGKKQSARSVQKVQKEPKDKPQRSSADR